LQYGTFTLVDADNPDVFAYTRTLNNKTFLILLNFKNKTASVKTGLDLSKGKTVLNNYGSANVSETLQPYEASVIEL
jgi:oligo-1,6-glucosidase